MPESIRMICGALNSLPNPIIIYDRDGKVIDANRAACLVRGVDSISDLERPVELNDLFTKALTGEYCTMEYCVIDRKTGQEKWLKAQVNPVYTDENTPSGISVLEKDITTNKTMLRELVSMKGKK